MLAETVIPDLVFFLMLIATCVGCIAAVGFFLDWLLIEPRRTWGRIEKTVDDIQGEVSVLVYEVDRIKEKVKHIEKELS